MLPAQVSSHVPGHDVSFEVDDRAAFVTGRDRALDRVRDQGDPERAWRLIHRRDGQAHAIDGNGSLDRDKPRDGVRKPYGYFAPGRRLFDGPDRTCGVHVALHKVTV